jgi:hypothetical protein
MGVFLVGMRTSGAPRARGTADVTAAAAARSCGAVASEVVVGRVPVDVDADRDRAIVER